MSIVSSFASSCGENAVFIGEIGNPEKSILYNRGMDKDERTVFWEAWEIELLPDGTRQINDECGHLHDTLDETRDHHRMHANYTHLVEIDYDLGEVTREVKHKTKRPKGFFGALIYDGVNS